MNLELIRHDDIRLRSLCQPVTFDQPFDQATPRKMAMLMDEKNGVGLAAPQVGILERFFVMKCSDNKVILVINPTITSHGKQLVENTEGCLSFPGMSKFVMRHRVIEVAFKSPGGRDVGMKLKGRDAAIFQHELDHLDGTCIFESSEVPTARPEGSAVVADEPSPQLSDTKQTTLETTK